MEPEEMVEHTVEVDEFLEVTLKIPRRLNAMSLKALMSKASKLFNLAEIPMVPKKRAYTRRSNGNKKHSPFSEESLVDLKKWVAARVPYKEIVDRLNKKHKTELNLKQVQMKVYNMKKRGQW